MVSAAFQTKNNIHASDATAPKAITATGHLATIRLGTANFLRSELVAEPLSLSLTFEGERRRKIHSIWRSYLILGCFIRVGKAAARRPPPRSVEAALRRLRRDRTDLHQPVMAKEMTPTPPRSSLPDRLGG
jgi:hypothetical protein